VVVTVQKLLPEVAEYEKLDVRLVTAFPDTTKTNEPPLLASVAAHVPPTSVGAVGLSPQPLNETRMLARAAAAVRRRDFISASQNRGLTESHCRVR
jgi:hypothetical protein